MRFPRPTTWPGLLVAVLLAAGSAAMAQSDRASAAKPAEYMIYQYPSVSLVVVIDARETEFESSIKGPEGAPVSETAIAARRIGPVYQFVDPVNTPRQLMIAVNPAQPIGRSRISMELLQLPESDRNARAVARAYRYLAHGMKRVHTDTTTTWVERTHSLQNAAQAFASLGMEEMRLWSEYYAAHLVLHQIGDVVLARERAERIQAAARRAGFETIELAAATLEAEAGMLAGEKTLGLESRTHYEHANDRWERVARLAEEQGYPAERGRALYRDGIAYERQGRMDRAIERYEQALEVTASAADPDLLNAIRATAAAAYENRGSTSGAISLLEDITGDLSGGETTAEQELARNLYEKGRLLNSTFRFAAAAEELSRALELQRSDPAGGQWGLTGLELGRAQYAQGYLDSAKSTILESLPRMPQSEKDARAEAHGVLAAISREQGRPGQAAEFRAQQGQLLGSESERPAFLFESALDALARDGSGSAEAARLLREGRDRAVGSDLLTGHRAELYLCLVDLQARGSGACDPDRVRASHDLLGRSGIPAVEVDAGLVWVQVLRLAGRTAEARARMADLFDSVQFYRERLPGVIAAWFGSRREELYREYLELASGASGERLLLALDSVRRMERVTPDVAAPEDDIRNLVARALGAQPAPAEGSTRAADEELEAFRGRSGWTSGGLTRDELRDALDGLGRDESLLAYHFSGSRIYAVSGSRRGVAMQRLAGAAQVRARIDAARASLFGSGANVPDGDLDALGRLLLAPLEYAPGENLYLLSSGPLNGFPFDTLRLNGRYLAERTRVINVDSLAALEGLPELSGDYGERVFVAGNPRAGRDLFSYGVSTSAEIDAVRDRFVGGGLHIVQGVALRGDEFEDERYREAALAHLAMPGRVDLAYPERSRLLLSGERESPAAEFLSPAQLRGIGMAADLAVLSGTVLTGSTRTDFDSRLGLIHDLHQAGARRVLAAMWPAGDDETARFMSSFYQALESEPDVIEALFRARQSRIAAKSDTNIRTWAGFQLFIR